MNEIVFWGASSHAKVLYDFVEDQGFRIVAFVDRHHHELAAPAEGIPLLSVDAFDDWLSRREGDLYFATAIGGSKGKDKVDIHDRLVARGLKPTILLHPKSYVSRNATLAPGCQVTSNVSIVMGVQMGKECLVNTNSSVDHESVLERGVHVSAGVTIGALVTIGEYSFIGMGASVMSRVRIGKNVIIGAGAVVIHDVPDNMIAYGVPARVMRVNDDLVI